MNKFFDKGLSILVVIVSLGLLYSYWITNDYLFDEVDHVFSVNSYAWTSIGLAAAITTIEVVVGSAISMALYKWLPDCKSATAGVFNTSVSLATVSIILLMLAEVYNYGP